MADHDQTKPLAEEDLLEQIAGRYLDPDATFSVDEQLMAILALRVLPQLRGPEVLELGVGADVWSAAIIQRFGRSHVVDASARLLQGARERHGDGLITYHSLFETFEPDRRFDTVVASMVLEHVEDPVALLARIQQWVVPAGQVIIVVPNANSLHRQYGVCLGLLERTTALSEADRSIGHRRVYTPELLGRHIAQAGLTVRERWPTFIKLLSNAQMRGWSRAQLEGLFELARRLPLELGASLLLDCC